MRASAVTALVAAGAVVVGCLGPWAQLKTFELGDVTVGGLSRGVGWIVLALTLIAAVGIVARQSWGLLVAVVAECVLVVVVYTQDGLLSLYGGYQVAAGWGALLAGAALLVLVGCGMRRLPLGR